MPTGQHCFISSSQFFQRLSGHFTKTSSKQNEIAGKVSLTLFCYFIVSPVFIAALDVSVMGGMILQWVSYFCQNNVKHKFSSQCTYKPRQLGLRICQRYFKNITILLCQATFTKYDYDKYQRKNRSGFFLWTVVAPQRYPKKELLQMFWVFCRKTVMKVWFFKKLQLSELGPYKKQICCLGCYENFLKSGRERRELQFHIIGTTLGTSRYVRKVIFVFSSVNFMISRIFKISFWFVTGHKLCSRESTWDAG